MREDFVEQFPKKKLQEIWESTTVEPGALYIVGTPIGNLGDISVRALSTLAQVDIVLAEDTRTSSELLLPFGIKPHYLSFHQHNFRSRIDAAIADLQSGKSIAQISDAGMPTISDPGVELVDACLDAGLEVRVVPGPSASIAIVSLGGLPADDFRFVGFLPQKEIDKHELLEDIKNYKGITVLYEAPHRLLQTLNDLVAAGLGKRKLVLGRELTKRYEEVIRDTVENIIAYYSDNKTRGEFVLLLGKASAEEAAAQNKNEKLELKEQIEEALKAGKTSKTILLELQDECNLSKNDLKKLISTTKSELEN